MSRNSGFSNGAKPKDPSKSRYSDFFENLPKSSKKISNPSKLQTIPERPLASPDSSE